MKNGIALKRIGIWTLSGLLLGFSIPVWALDNPQELAGKWYANGSEYIVEVRGPQIILHKPYKSGTRNPYVGLFNPNGFDVRFRPEHVQQLNPELPDPVRQQVVARGHQFRGHLDFSKPGKIIFTEQVDHIFYNADQAMLTGIEQSQNVTTVELVKDAGFKIGAITVDDTMWSQRIQRETEALQQELERLRSQDIPVAEQQANESEKTLLTLAEEMETRRQESKRLEQENTRIRNEIQTAVTQNNPEYDRLDKQRTQLNQELTAIQGVMEDYHSKGNLAGIRSLQKQVENKQQALQAVSRQIANQYSQRDSVGNLEQRFAQQQRQNYEISNQLSEMQTRFNRLRESYEGKLQNLQALQTTLLNRQNQLTYLQRKPIIDRIELNVKGQQHFLAEAEQNNELWQQFEENFATIDQELVRLREQKQSVEQEREPLRLAMNEARANFDEARTAIRLAGDEIYQALLKSAAAHAAAETASYATDLGLAFKDGGPAALLIELSGKAIESLSLGVTGETSFDLFDETPLREQLFGPTTKPFQESFAASDGDEHYHAPSQRREPAEPQLSPVSQFRKDKIDEIPLEAGKEIVNQTKDIFERRTLERQAADAAKYLADHPFDTALRDAPEHALDRLAVAQRELGEAYNAAQAVRRQTGAASSELGHLSQAGKEYRTALRRQRVAMEDLSQTLTEQLGSLDRIQRNRAALQQANRKIADLGTLGSKVGGIVKGVGQGIVTDGLKAFVDHWIEEEERVAWMAFFEKEIYLQSARATMQAASNEYYGLADKLKLMDESIIALQQFRQQTEADRQAYLESKQRTGFHIASNMEFEPMDPIEMRVTTIGYSHGERIQLEKQGDPGGQNVVEGQRVRPTTPPIQPSNAGISTSLDRQVHYYVFPAARMGTTQVRQPLPLRISLQ